MLLENGESSMVWFQMRFSSMSAPQAWFPFSRGALQSAPHAQMSPLLWRMSPFLTRLQSNG